MSVKHKHDFILKISKNKDVLHIGATDEPFHKERFRDKSLLHLKLQKVAKNVIGLDYDKKSIKYLKNKGINDIYFGDIVKNKYDPIIKSKEYDIVFFGDVIEHLNNPGLGLQNLKSLMGPKTLLILTTPNVWSIFRIINFFKKNEVNHPDHRFWPSYCTLKTLIEKEDFKIVKSGFLLVGSKKRNLSTLRGKLFKKLFLNRIPRWSNNLYFIVRLN